MKSEDYLDLLEKTLTFSLWPEPLKPVTAAAPLSFKVRAAQLADDVIEHLGVRLAFQVEVADGDRENGTHWPALAHTMVGRKRLRNIRALCRIVDMESIAGSWVECGVWRGGASIYARACLDPNREVWCCDSFTGFPFDKKDTGYKVRFIAVSKEEVEQNFRNYDLLDNVRFLKGWFCDTLPLVPAPIAILRADGDLHQSTVEILKLYPKVSRGGFIIIDDYGVVPGCKVATDDFRDENNITVPLQWIDHSGVYWRKP